MYCTKLNPSLSRSEGAIPDGQNQEISVRYSKGLGLISHVMLTFGSLHKLVSSDYVYFLSLTGRYNRGKEKILVDIGCPVQPSCIECGIQGNFAGIYRNFRSDMARYPL